MILDFYLKGENVLILNQNIQPNSMWVIKSFKPTLIMECFNDNMNRSSNIQLSIQFLEYKYFPETSL